MLGLWSLGTTPLGLILHLAFDVALDDLLDAPKRLKTQGIKPLSFFGVETTEPSVIGWMPADKASPSEHIEKGVRRKGSRWRE
jgi:lactoylglutathione lyase